MSYPGAKERPAKGMCGELIIWGSSLIFRVYKTGTKEEYKDYVVNNESLQVIIDDDSASLYEYKYDPEGILDASSDTTNWRDRFR